jgi:hypothetical protein
MFNIKMTLMKKITILFAICASLLAVSCKKNYSCVCTNVPRLGPNGTNGTRITDLGKQTKKVATDACNNIYKEMPSNQKITCEIK